MQQFVKNSSKKQTFTSRAPLHAVKICSSSPPSSPPSSSTIHSASHLSYVRPWFLTICDQVTGTLSRDAPDRSFRWCVSLSRIETSIEYILCGNKLLERRTGQSRLTALANVEGAASEQWPEIFAYKSSYAARRELLEKGRRVRKTEDVCTARRQSNAKRARLICTSRIRKRASRRTRRKTSRKHSRSFRHHPRFRFSILSHSERRLGRVLEIYQNWLAGPKPMSEA